MRGGEDLAAIHEQRDFERREREAKEARILTVARAEPGLMCIDLAERFGMSDSAMQRLLKAHGLHRAMSDRMDYRRCNVKYSYCKTRAP